MNTPILKLSLDMKLYQKGYKLWHHNIENCIGTMFGNNKSLTYRNILKIPSLINQAHATLQIYRWFYLENSRIVWLMKLTN